MDCIRTLRLYGGGRFAASDTASQVSECFRAGDLLPVDGRVVSTLEPVAKTELAARLESTRQLRASVAAQATVLCAPSRSRCSPLGCASVEQTNTSTRDSKVELASSYISANVFYMSQQTFMIIVSIGNILVACTIIFLPAMDVEVKVSLDLCQKARTLTESINYTLVARAASVRLAATGGNSSEAVSEIVRDNPGALVGAHVSIAAIAGGCGVEVRQGRVVLVAHGDWARDISLVGP